VSLVVGLQRIKLLTQVICILHTESLYPVKTKYIVADFSSGRDIYEKIRKQLIPLDVGILVNNVGVAPEMPGYFKDTPEDLLWDIINVNIGAVTIMTRMIIPKMKKKRRGIIVNISSGSDIHPVSLMANYSSSKAYNKYLTLGKNNVPQTW
jgi:17beta-estradiol 17-dehydrogenase / very-long-chain 3-oxoacyl-CoA reductase